MFTPEILNYRDVIVCCLVGKKFNTVALVSLKQWQCLLLHFLGDPSQSLRVNRYVNIRYYTDRYPCNSSPLSSGFVFCFIFIELSEEGLHFYGSSSKNKMGE